MAFNPDRLSLVVQPIGEHGMRWFDYQSDDTEDVLTGTGYFQNAEDHGLRLYDLIFVSPEAGAVEPYVLVVDDIAANGHATATAKLENLEREITKTDAQYDKTGALYALNAYDTDVAVKISGTPEGPRTKGKALLHVEAVDEGCGTASSPSLAGVSLSASIFKQGWPSTSAADGEMDTSRFTYRQVNGDAAAVLGNGTIINGFGCFFEAVTTSIDDVTFAVKHQVAATGGVVNDRDDAYYGFIAAKSYAAGGTGFLAHTTLGGAWDYGIQLKDNGVTQFEQKVSDASIRLYQYGAPANFYDIKVVSGGLQITDASGNVAQPLNPAPADYTPVATSSGGGAIGSGATLTGRWQYQATKSRFVSMRAIVPDIGAMTGGFRLTLPVAASASANGIAVWYGMNMSTGTPIIGTIGQNGTYVNITQAISPYGFPLTSGQTLWISGTYETA